MNRLKTYFLSLALALASLPAAASASDSGPAADQRQWHAIRPSGLEYTVTAPYKVDNQLLIEASPETVFKVLIESDWREWFVDFKSVEWTSPRPYQVGSTRTVTTGMLAVKERFLAWDPGRRLSFSIDAVNWPLLEGMMEDMQLEPVDNGRATRFHWRVFYTPGPLMAAVHPIAGAIFGNTFTQSLQNLKKFIEK
ncbi:MAG: SRPBCC family protein [Candidatus Sericytochromatia bacterium]